MALHLPPLSNRQRGILLFVKVNNETIAVDAMLIFCEYLFMTSRMLYHCSEGCIFPHATHFTAMQDLLHMKIHLILGGSCIVRSCT